MRAGVLHSLCDMFLKMLPLLLSLVLLSKEDFIIFSYNMYCRNLFLLIVVINSFTMNNILGLVNEIPMMKIRSVIEEEGILKKVFVGLT